MKYRELGRTGLRVSALSMGCMRLPQDDEAAGELVDRCIAAGINYFETTRGYLGGRCQHKTALGLRGRSRELIVSGKAGVGPDTTAGSYRAEVDLQMKVLGVDWLEFFQVGWFSADKLPLLEKKGGALKALDKARAEGLIGHVGFTGHDSPQNFIKVLESGHFESMTVVYNMINRSYEPTIRRAGELGIGVVVMCPIGGGLLAEPSSALREAIPGSTSTVGAALRFVLSNPNVSTACSGMSSLQQLEENVTLVDSLPYLSEEERAASLEVLDRFKALGEKVCTSCRYCMDCPHGVDIPRNFRLYNLHRVYGLTDWAKRSYASMNSGQRADSCTECGECEPKCPNAIPIREQLAAMAKELGGLKG